VKLGRDKTALAAAWNALTEGIQEINRLDAENQKLRTIIRGRVGTRSDYWQTLRSVGLEP
jgi:hypothetical protein